MSAHELAPRLPRTARLLSHQWAALAVVLTGTFIVVLDFFIVNVAMPAMQSDLHAGTGAIEWVVAGYGLTFATLLITAGRLGDQLGRRRMFALGIALFTLASAACGLAPSPAVLVAARLVQGLAAALLSPQVLSIIGVAYSGPDRVRAISVYGIVIGLAAVGGQLIGGVLVQADVAGLGWRSVLPHQRAHRPRRPGRRSPARCPSRASRAPTGWTSSGTALITLGAGRRRPAARRGPPARLARVDVAVPRRRADHARPLRRPPAAPEPPRRHAAARSGAVSRARLQRRPRDPARVLPSMASYFLVLALYLQQGRGLDALQAGLVFTILAAAYLVASAYAPGLTPRLGRRLPAIGGLLLAAGHGAAGPERGRHRRRRLGRPARPGHAARGRRHGPRHHAADLDGARQLEPQNAGAAAGALSTMQQVGNALGVAVTGVIFFGALDGGFGHAFEVSLVQLAVLGAAVAALTWLLPRREAVV